MIIGYNDLMMSELEPEGRPYQCAEEIRHASERAAGLTRQLLVYSRKKTTQPVVLDLGNAVQALDKMLRRLLGENIELTIIRGEQSGCIKADSGYIGQLIMNMAVNARDAMPNGGNLTITTRDVTLGDDYTDAHPVELPGDFVMLRVSDTGSGMTDEVKAHLFETFFTTKPVGQGTGLGLATCQNIVRQSGGHIHVESEIEHGTTFSVYFPRVEERAEGAARPTQASVMERGTETVLIVEDEPSLRELARCALEEQGYKVLSASNGQEGLRVAREHQGSPIRLVVSDVVMPLMGGKMMADRLILDYPDLKILFVSGFTDDAITHHGVLDSGVEFLSKPYSSAALTSKVRELLDYWPAQAQAGPDPTI